MPLTIKKETSALTIDSQKVCLCLSRTEHPPGPTHQDPAPLPPSSPAPRAACHAGLSTWVVGSSIRSVPVARPNPAMHPLSREAHGGSPASSSRGDRATAVAAPLGAPLREAVHWPMDSHLPDKPAAGVARGQSPTVDATTEGGVEADAAASMAARRPMPAERPLRSVPPRAHRPAPRALPTGLLSGAERSPGKAAAAADSCRRGRDAPPTAPPTAPQDVARTAPRAAQGVRWQTRRGRHVMRPGHCRNRSAVPPPKGGGTAATVSAAVAPIAAEAGWRRVRPAALPCGGTGETRTPNPMPRPADPRVWARRGVHGRDRAIPPPSAATADGGQCRSNRWGMTLGIPLPVQADVELRAAD